MTVPFSIDYLDHVAIRVKDIDRSIEWYSSRLGLDLLKLKEWGDVPVFMWNGQTGVALFPANLEDPKLHRLSKNVKIDHFAFYVSGTDFQKARAFFDSIDQAFEFQDHHYFQSIYLIDPDGHKVELTTKVKDW